MLRSFFAGDRLTSMPRRGRKRQIVLEQIVQRFEPGRRYDEAEVNLVLRQVWPHDVAALRRYLVDAQLLDRADGRVLAHRRSGRRMSARPTTRSRGSQRARGGVPPFHVMRVIDAVVARRAAGLPVIDLSAGQPSTPAPARRPRAPPSRRSRPTGSATPTRSASRPCARRSPSTTATPTVSTSTAANVAVTTGSSGGFLYAFLSAFDAGDTVAMARPGYPAYRNMLAALGCTVVELPCGPETRFQPTVAQLDALDEPPAGLVLASPANPTGTMVDAAELAALTAWCDAHGTRLISDEIYHGITFGMSAASAWRTSRRAIVVNSFSKYFSMTGWRIGWLLVPDDLLDSVDRLAGNFAICPPALSQFAAVAAFDAYDELDANVARYAANRAMAARGAAADRARPPGARRRRVLRLRRRLAVDR